MRILSTLALGIALAAGPVLAADVAPPAWTVDRDKSAITFKGTHAGSPFEGAFKDWTAAIRFAPDNTASNAMVTIKTGSAETGNTLYDGTLPGPDWFDSAKFPDARFQSRAITHGEGDNYTVDGLLTIRDETKPISFPARISTADGVATLNATVTVNRVDFGVGKAPDPEGAWVSRDIEIVLSVTAVKAADAAAAPAP